MNKIVLGSALVAVMGGVPGATYLLTRDSEDKNASSREEDQRQEAGDVSSGSSGVPSPAGAQASDGDVTCPNKEAEKPCPPSEA